AAPAGAVADASAVRAAQRERRAGNRARGAALGAGGGGASTSRNHRRVTAGRDRRACITPSAPSRPASLTGSATRTHRGGATGQCAALHDLRHGEGAQRFGHHREAGLRASLVCHPGVCATEVRLRALPARRGASRPAARPIEKGRPGPGLLAHVVSSKYADHLPLYRLEQIFERHGVQITRRTLSEWNGAVADLLEPPYTGSRCASRRGFNATTRPWMCRTRVARQRLGPGICGSIGASWARWCTILPGRAIVTGR